MQVLAWHGILETWLLPPLRGDNSSCQEFSL